jgi:hypothetical protein
VTTLTYIVIAPAGARVCHVAEYDPGGGWGRSACGKSGEVHRIDRGSRVFGGLTVCRQCSKRSSMARHLARAVDAHRSGFLRDGQHR